jgi:hypothetical protein
MADGRDIPVFLGAPRRGQPDDFAYKPPIVHVHVASDQAWNIDSGRGPEHNGVTYSALLDTGADSTVIDPEVARHLPNAVKHRALLSGFGDASAVEGVDVQIFFPAANIVFPERAAISSLKSSGATFDLVLGRTFLRNCCFKCDGLRGLYTLRWKTGIRPDVRDRRIRIPGDDL